MRKASHHAFVSPGVELIGDGRSCQSQGDVLAEVGQVTFDAVQERLRVLRFACVIICCVGLIPPRFYLGVRGDGHGAVATWGACGIPTRGNRHEQAVAFAQWAFHVADELVMIGEVGGEGIFMHAQMQHERAITQRTLRAFAL